MTDLASIPALAADKILDRGWTQGEWEATDKAVCLHQAVRSCSPQTGDGYIVSAWLTANGYGTSWNDQEDRDRDDVLFLLKGLDLTDADFANTFGPNWLEWARLMRLLAGMTSEQAVRLAAARAAAGNAAGAAAGAAARAVAWDAVWDAAGAAVWAAARAAAWDAVWDAAGAAVWAAAGAAAGAAARAVAWDAVWDAARAAARNAAGAAIGKPKLAQEHYDLLMRPIVEVFGPDWADGR